MKEAENARSVSATSFTRQSAWIQIKQDLHVCFKRVLQIPLPLCVCLCVIVSACLRGRISVGCLHPLHQTSSQQGF